jgi:hypothetical protein
MKRQLRTNQKNRPAKMKEGYVKTREEGDEGGIRQKEKQKTIKNQSDLQPSGLLLPRFEQDSRMARKQTDSDPASKHRTRTDAEMRRNGNDDKIKIVRKGKEKGSGKKTIKVTMELQLERDDRRRRRQGTGATCCPRQLVRFPRRSEDGLIRYGNDKGLKQNGNRSDYLEHKAKKGMAKIS